MDEIPPDEVNGVLYSFLKYLQISAQMLFHSKCCLCLPELARKEYLVFFSGLPGLTPQLLRLGVRAMNHG